MSDKPMQPQTAETELARHLEAYAAARLSPSAAASARMRSRVMAAAGARLATQAGARSAAEPTSISAAREERLATSRRTLARPRRFAVGLLAASLALVGVAGAALAANPGGPLYDARLWLERATMPTEPGARATAELERLDRRLGEAVHAAGDGNQGAVAAALAAYRQTLDDAVSETTETDRTERLEPELERHRAVLQTLLGTVPNEAHDAIQNAIDKSDKATEAIGRHVPTPRPTPKPHPTPKSTPGPNPGGGGGQGGGGGHGGGNGNGHGGSPKG